jgi:small subunit ribosomal protein S36
VWALPQPKTGAPRHARRRGLPVGLASVPAAAWLVTALWLALLLGASLLWPMSYGLDEPQHIDMAYDYAAHPFTFYGPGQLPLSLADVGMQHALPGYPPRTRFAVVPIPARPDRPTFTQLGGHAFEKGGQPNQMDQHPPLYYWLEAAVLSLPGVSGLAWDLQVWLMRLLSVVIMAPVPLLCWSSARRVLAAPFGRLRPESAARLAVLAAALPLTIPDLVRDGSSVDNDTLLLLATSVILWGLTRVITGDTRLRSAAIISAALAVALWTKGFALALPPIILVAYLLAPRQGDRRPGVVRAVWKPVAVVAVGGAIGSIWWIRNVVDYHTVQPDGFGSYVNVIYGPPDHKGTLSHFISPFLDGFIYRIWGEVGLPDLPSPGPLIIYGWFFVALIGVVAALTVKGRPGRRRRLGALALAPLAYFGIAFEGSYSTFRTWADVGVRADQGRYIFGGVVVLATLFAVGWFELARPRFHGRLALLVVTGALVTNAATWLLILRSWYQPVTNSGYGSGTSLALHALLRWSPTPEVVTILLVGVLPVVAGLACLVAVGRAAREWGGLPGERSAREGTVPPAAVAAAAGPDLTDS